MVDLPKNSYDTKLKAYKNSYKFISTSLADLIKIEIGTNNFDIAKYLIEKNIPYVRILVYCLRLLNLDLDFGNMVKVKMKPNNCMTWQ